LVTPLSGWIDIDRPSLPALTPLERIDYFEKRVRLVLIEPLRRILDTEIHVKGCTSSALLIFGVSVCCAIEASGKFIIGVKTPSGAKTKNQDRFYEFLKRMDRRFQTELVNGQTYGESLWKHFRNGLAHGFAVCHGGFEGSLGQQYFQVRKIVGTECLLVNPHSLFDDFESAFVKYLQDLRAAAPSGTLFTVFDSIFKDVFILGN
jgi:hypothetical protein